MSEVAQSFVRFFTSLRLTVVLLALSGVVRLALSGLSVLVIVYAVLSWVQTHSPMMGLLARLVSPLLQPIRRVVPLVGGIDLSPLVLLVLLQVGIVGVQERFFRTFFVLSFWGKGHIPVPVFPGGYLIGGLLMINLITTHVYRFKFTWKKAGIQLTHFGLIVLLLGELITGILQEDFILSLNEGETKAYSEAFRDNELVIMDTTDPDFDDVVAIPESWIAKGDPIQHGKLPFRVIVRSYYPNANLGMLHAQAEGSPGLGMAPNLSTQDIGPRLAIFPNPSPIRITRRTCPPPSSSCKARKVR